MLAVEALPAWDEVDAVNDWECILDVLLLDHSACRDEGMDGPDSLSEPARNTVDPAWQLSELEVTVLPEVIMTSLRRAKLASTTRRKVRLTSLFSLMALRSCSSRRGDEETVVSYLTRALIKGLHTKIVHQASSFK